MIFLENDYSEGAHPLVLQRLLDTNLTPQPGYGADEYSLHARDLIRRSCASPEADVLFIPGGTQTNALVTGGLLRPWEAAVSADTGHINVHEAGAVEFTGHKVLTVPGRRGLMDPSGLRRILEGFFADPNHTHMAFPGLVYISHPTEFGTLYSLRELEEISGICKSFRVPLYLDGARLAYGLAAETDVQIRDIARLCHVFYIGGTKCGALCGEALVFPRGMPEHFDTVQKQRGAMPAKGRLCGAQFEALFENGLYLRLGRHGVERAMEIRQGLLDRGFRLFVDSPTNQQFPIFDNALLRRLEKEVRFSFWEPFDDTSSVVRLAASWATEPQVVSEFFKILDKLRV